MVFVTVKMSAGIFAQSHNKLFFEQGELDPSAVSIDCSGQVATDPLLRFYIPSGVEIPPNTFGTMHNEAKIRGSILMP